MRGVLLVVALAVTAAACRADDALTATGILHGKRVKFQEAGRLQGAKVTIALLESCHDVDETTPALADLKKARKAIMSGSCSPNRSGSRSWTRRSTCQRLSSPSRPILVYSGC